MSQRSLRPLAFACCTLAISLASAGVAWAKKPPEAMQIPIPDTVLPLVSDIQEGPLRITIPNVDASKQGTTPISSRALHLLFSRFLKENQQREVLAQPLPVLSISTPSTSVIYSVVSRFVAVAADDGTPPAWQAVLSQKASNSMPVFTAVPSLKSMSESFELAKITQRPEPVKTEIAEATPEPKKEEKAEQKAPDKKTAAKKAEKKSKHVKKNDKSKHIASKDKEKNRKKSDVAVADAKQKRDAAEAQKETAEIQAAEAAHDFSIAKLFDQLFIEDRAKALPTPASTQLVLNAPPALPAPTEDTKLADKKKDKKLTVTANAKTKSGNKKAEKEAEAQTASLEVHLDGEDALEPIEKASAQPAAQAPASPRVTIAQAAEQAEQSHTAPAKALPWQVASTTSATPSPASPQPAKKEADAAAVESPKPEFFFSKLFMTDQSEKKNASAAITTAQADAQAQQMASLTPASGGEPPAAQDLSGEVLVPSTPETLPAPIPPRPAVRAEPAPAKPAPKPVEPARPTPEQIAQELAAERQAILNAAPPAPAEPAPASTLTAEEQELLKSAPPAPEPQQANTEQPEPAQDAPQQQAQTPAPTPEPQQAQAPTPEPEPTTPPAPQQAEAPAPAAPAEPPKQAAEAPKETATPEPTQEAKTQPAPPSQPVTEPTKEMSAKALLKTLPEKLGEPQQTAKAPFTIDRATSTREIFDPTTISEADQATKHEAIGVKIEVKTPRIDVNYELEKAYNALMQGQTVLAKDIYNNVLDNDSNNVLALFGLATTYHRNGEFTQARALYAKILTLDPDNRDALNNFLALVSSEVPHEALNQLEKLESKNPDFSPIPAQMAIIYQKLGNPEKAIQKMLRAVSLEPENLTYRYNLAVLMDRVGKRDEAAALYRQLVAAYQKGAQLPGSIHQIQERLTFLSSNRR